MSYMDIKGPGRIEQWYHQRVQNAPVPDSLKRGYEDELAKFHDSFERISALDGSEQDLHGNPGEVHLKKKTKYHDDEALVRTRDGFRLQSSSAKVSSAGSESSTTSYQIRHGSPVIEVTRKESYYDAGSETGGTDTKTFALDTSSGLLLANW